MEVKDLFKEENMLDLYRLSRFMYANGRRLISDSKYNELEKKVKERFRNNELLRQTYDDDKYPMDILSKYNIRLKEDLAKELNAPKISNHPRIEEIRKFIQTEGTKSIEAYETYEDCYRWFMSVRDQKLIASLKVDGINSRSVLLKCNPQPENTPPGKVAYELVCSSTRGRIGTAFDITETLGYKFPQYVYLNKDISDNLNEDVSEGFMVYGEPYVIESAIPYLKHKYGVTDKWVNPRSTAISILRVPIERVDYQYLKFKVFKVTGLSNSLSETLTIAKQLGFDVVPNVTIEPNTAPTDFNQFKEWLKNILKDFTFITKDLTIESDGVVFEIDNQIEFTLQGSKNQYNLGNIAVKMEHWGSRIYKSRVVDFMIEGQGSKFSCRAKIEPVTVYNKTTATVVNCFSPAIMIYNNINIGSEISFEYKSASSIDLVYEPVPDDFPYAYVLQNEDNNEEDN